jgi:apyrase
MCEAYEAMAIVAFAMGILVLLLGPWLIRRAFWGKSPTKSDAETTRVSTRAIAIILGGGLIWLAGAGGLIWLGLHYGFEFHERLIARVSPREPDKPQVALPKQSSACNTAEARYGLIIDAGSSGSRIYIYCWKPAGVNGIPWVTAAPAQAGERPWMWKVDDKPLSALSAFSSDTDANGTDAKNYLKDSLEPLTDYAIGKIGKDPQTLKEIPLHVMATAGMRLLGDKDKNTIIGMVEKYLTEKDKFARARMTIIPGRKEALYGWIAVNYLMGLLKAGDGNSSPTMGILELGGASTQIAYALPNAPAQGLATLQWGKTAYQIYVNSLPGSGQDEALKEINKPYTDGNASKAEEKKLNPCYPEGYKDTKVGKGNWDYDLCQERITKFLNKKIADPKNSDLSEIQPRGAFLAYAGYYYARAHFKKQLAPVSSLGDFKGIGIKTYCQRMWSNIQLEDENQQNKEHLPRYCFNAAYIAGLLETGYHFKDTQQIIIADTLQGNEISWTLGAMIDMAGAKLTLEEE